LKGQGVLWQLKHLRRFGMKREKTVEKKSPVTKKIKTVSKKDIVAKKKLQTRNEKIVSMYSTGKYSVRALATKIGLSKSRTHTIIRSQLDQ
jgi:hypothetical protein